jgi:hypothetical protein
VIVVADASPLIYLSALGRLDLLRVLYVRVLVPRTVFDEVVVVGQGEMGSGEVAAATWIEVREVGWLRGEADCFRTCGRSWRGSRRWGFACHSGRSPTRSRSRANRPEVHHADGQPPRDRGCSASDQPLADPQPPIDETSRRDGCARHGGPGIARAAREWQRRRALAAHG